MQLGKLDACRYASPVGGEGSFEVPGSPIGCWWDCPDPEVGGFGGLGAPGELPTGYCAMVEDVVWSGQLLAGAGAADGAPMAEWVGTGYDAGWLSRWLTVGTPAEWRKGMVSVWMICCWCARMMLCPGLLGSLVWLRPKPIIASLPCCWLGTHSGGFP